MYIMINDIKGEKRIDLSYSIDSDKEIAVIIMLSDNIQYTKTLFSHGSYFRQEKDDFKWNLHK